MNNQMRFNQIVEDIKQIRIQGARNIAKAALYAYHLNPTLESKKKLLSLRPTEPMLSNVLNMIGKKSYKEILKHFDDTQQAINKNVFKLIKNGDVIFTHCHSTNVITALIYSHKKGKKFKIVNTETRPLLQGRKTAEELKKAGIKVTQYIDSAAMIAITKGNSSDTKIDKIFFGADAILKNGIINKIGSGMFAQIAFDNKVPVYIIADSWKFSPKNVKIEERNFKEVWNKMPRYIKIKNPAFEFIPRKHIKAIVSEYGILSFDKFLRKVLKSQ